MRLPKIIIEWNDRGKYPQRIKIHKLTNGYLIGNSFIASKEKLADELIIALENPDAYFEPPEYRD